MNERTIEIEKYWPSVVRDTAEFQQIANALNPELNKLKNSLYDILKDAFINDLTEYGVNRWEKILGLPVTPTATLEERKVTILTYLSIRRPYTWRVLKQMLTELLGEGNFEMSFDNETQVLTVGLASTVEHLRGQVDDLIARVVPQNLEIKCDPLPIEYTPVEYLESTGTQWLNTGYIANSETTTKTRWAFIEDLGNIGFIFEADAGPPRYGMLRNKSGTIRCDYGEAMNSANKVLDIGRVYDIEKRGRFNYVDGELVVTNPETEPFEQTVPMWISTPKSMYRAVFRLYSFIMENNNKSINLIPALDPTGTPCMYDLVSKQPFYNSGTGDFTYPTDSAPVMTTDLDEKFYAKMTEHGVRRLYKVPEGCTLSKDEYAAKHGFKELVEPPMPQTGYWTNVWKETDTQLICEWVETEPPMEVTEND